MIVVVGGQARKVGKTRAVCEIIAATRHARWMAVKLSPHDHTEASGNTDTNRYLQAGAAEATLGQNLPALPPDRNVIIESNAVLALLQPDLFIFVTDGNQSDWKDSARRVIDRADYVITGSVGAEVLARIAALLANPSR